MFVFLTYSSQPPHLAPPFREPWAARRDMGAWCLVGSIQLGAALGRLPPAPCLPSPRKAGGPVLAHWWSLLEALRFERKRDFLMDLLLQEYQSAPEKHWGGGKWFPSRNRGYRGRRLPVVRIWGPAWGSLCWPESTDPENRGEGAETCAWSLLNRVK